MYLLLGASVCLILLALSYALGSLVAGVCWRFLERRPGQANLIFFLRVAPAFVSLLFLGLAVIPSYEFLEPPDTGETLGWTLAAAAFLVACGLAFSIWRAARAWLAGRRLTSEWMRSSRPLDIDGIGIPAYSFDHSRPVVALDGIFRPRLFVARSVIDALLPEELAAAVAHERAHLNNRDNLRRVVLRLLPGLRAADRDWDLAAEMAADAQAGRRSAKVALDLASALIKVARLTPPDVDPAMSTCALLLSASPLSGRVELLTVLAGEAAEPRRNPWSTVAMVAGLATVVEVLTSPAGIQAAHEIVEVLVRSLR